MVVSCCERADLDEVVGEDAVSAPRSGSVDCDQSATVCTQSPQPFSGWQVDGQTT